MLNMKLEYKFNNLTFSSNHMVASQKLETRNKIGINTECKGICYSIYARQKFK